MERIDAHILGRDYSLMCPPEEKPSLQEAVRYVDERMQQVKGSGKMLGTERIAVMVAIQMAVELLNMRSPDGPLGTLAVGEYKSRIDHINSLLDEAMEPQEKLF